MQPAAADRTIRPARETPVYAPVRATASRDGVDPKTRVRCAKPATPNHFTTTTSQGTTRAVVAPPSKNDPNTPSNGKKPQRNSSRVRLKKRLSNSSPETEMIDATEARKHRHYRRRAARLAAVVDLRPRQGAAGSSRAYGQKHRSRRVADDPVTNTPPPENDFNAPSIDKQLTRKVSRTCRATNRRLSRTWRPKRRTPQRLRNDGIACKEPLLWQQRWTYEAKQRWTYETEQRCAGAGTSAPRFYLTAIPTRRSASRGLDDGPAALLSAAAGETGAEASLRQRRAVVGTKRGVDGRRSASSHSTACAGGI